MSMHRSRNGVIPVWFAIFALAAIFVPQGNIGWSLFLLVLGLAVPAMVYVQWHDPQLQRVGTGRQPTDGQRTTLSGDR